MSSVQERGSKFRKMQIKWTSPLVPHEGGSSMIAVKKPEDLGDLPAACMSLLSLASSSVNALQNG